MGDMNAKQTATAIRAALTAGDREAARDLFTGYISAGPSPRSVNVRRGLLGREGIVPRGQWPVDNDVERAEAERLATEHQAAWMKEHEGTIWNPTPAAEEGRYAEPYCGNCAGDEDPSGCREHTGGASCRACEGCNQSPDYCTCAAPRGGLKTNHTGRVSL